MVSYVVQLYWLPQDTCGQVLTPLPWWGFRGFKSHRSLAFGFFLLSLDAFNFLYHSSWFFFLCKTGGQKKRNNNSRGEKKRVGNNESSSRNDPLLSWLRFKCNYCCRNLYCVAIWFHLLLFFPFQYKNRFSEAEKATRERIEPRRTPNGCDKCDTRHYDHVKLPQ